MNYQDAIKHAKIYRSSWMGFYLDTASNKIIWKNESGKTNSVEFRANPAELAATDWQSSDELMIKLVSI